MSISRGSKRYTAIFIPVPEWAPSRNVYFDIATDL